MKLFFSFASLLLAAQTLFAQEQLPSQVPTPADNPTTEAKVLLGKTLYFDPRLSLDGTVSCNSCHNVMAAGEDGRPTSVGIKGQRGGRNAPTVWNSGFLTVQFWDGRAATLEDQAKGPLVNPIEMGMPNHQAVIERIKKIPGYQAMFDAAFGKSKNNINIDNVAKAIASFERTLVAPSRFDRWMAGDKKALSDIEVQGFETMKAVGCFSCHMGPNFAGPMLPLGTGFYQKLPANPTKAYWEKYEHMMIQLKHKGISGILVTHDMPVAFHVCDRIGLLIEGELRFISSPKEIASHDKHPIQLFSQGLSYEQILQEASL